MTPRRRALWWTGWGVTTALAFAGLLALTGTDEPWGALGLHLAAVAVARGTIYATKGPLTGRMKWLRHGWALAFGPVLLAAGIVATGQSWAWWVVAFAPIIAFRWSL